MDLTFWRLQKRVSSRREQRGTTRKMHRAEMPPGDLPARYTEEDMAFEIWETPFSDVGGLGRNFILRTDDLVIEVFEYKESGPPEDIKVGEATIEGTRPMGLTKESRAWRVIFENPIAFRVRDESHYLAHPERDSFPSAYCISKDSKFIEEIKAEPLIDETKELIHYAMVLWDDLIEVISDKFPKIEEVVPAV